MLAVSLADFTRIVEARAFLYNEGVLLLPMKAVMGIDGNFWVGRNCRPDDELETLVQQARAGQKEAFGALFVRYYARVLAYLCKFTHNQTVAEDLTSEVFLRAMQAICGLERCETFEGWLYKIARNLAINNSTRQHRRPEVLCDLAQAAQPHFGDPAHIYELRVQQAAVRRALALLTDRQRECLTLRLLEGRPLIAVADALNVNAGTLSALQLRALRVMACILRTGHKPVMGRRRKPRGA